LSEHSVGVNYNGTWNAGQGTEVDTKLLIALITAASALIVSVVSALAQIWQVREKHRLERRLAQEAQLKEKSVAEGQNIQSAIRVSCAALQGVQDELELLLKAAPGSLMSGDHRNHLLNARDELRRVYREYYSVLSVTDRNILSAAREIAVHVLLMLDLEGVWQSELLSLQEQALNELERASASLGIRQQQLLLSAVKSFRSDTD
jgi:hypothetical protein